MQAQAHQHVDVATGRQLVQMARTDMDARITAVHEQSRGRHVGASNDARPTIAYMPSKLLLDLRNAVWEQHDAMNLEGSKQNAAGTVRSRYAASQTLYLPEFACDPPPRPRLDCI